ncbi:hypothetical protein [Arthrobacter sp. ISL-69]|uniref:hypothetical protein n=1 Tax=Arthrobacter sp. ISL-69 TaxID=2819113 RepID=UPI001BE95945|nr:hypothetical protein [Arthrobacter sp. ISL-69]MBT2537224.1 hypothetical protein [Arthrobacter sp. ISL-69]
MRTGQRIALAAIAVAATVALEWPRRKPAPAPAPVARTFVEHDLSELHVTPAVIEPSAYFTQLATHNAGLYVAYLRTGAFTRKQAFEAFQMHLDASLNQGRR